VVGFVYEKWEGYSGTFRFCSDLFMFVICLYQFHTIVYGYVGQSVF
jgi:hypothetical protein